MPNLVGIGLSQVPTNSMLGGLAYQSPDHASIKDLDLKNLSQINSEIANTAVDIFIYDTSKDSDGGAWRKRTTHTSWYNETLNTATRGSRKEFPAVAVIVSQNNKVTIYDGDDPDLPMWMVFDGNSSDMFTNGGTNYAVTSLNGILSLGENGAIWNAHFISDRGDLRNSTRRYDYKGNIEQRNDGLGYTDQETSGALVNSTVRDVAMTVLPNAPIDSATGLPIPTIAVATDGGVSVIKDDGNVYDITSTDASSNATRVKFTDDLKLIYVNNPHYSTTVRDIPSADVSLNQMYIGEYRYTSYDIVGGLNLIGDASAGAQGDVVPFPTTRFATRSTKGITIIDRLPSSPSNGMGADINSSYNTGWMHGNIKGAFLSDTDATNVTGTELVTNGTFDSDVSGWSAGSATITYSSGEAQVNATATNHYVSQVVTVTPNTTYTYSWQARRGTISTLKMSVFDNSNISNIIAPYDYNATTSMATYSKTFTTPSGCTNINVYLLRDSGATGTAFFDNASLRLADPDRSVNNKGLQVFGTVTKSAVATGAELVGYSGFSSSNYLLQPYNSDLDVGTGDISVIGWFKSSNSNGGYLFERLDPARTGNRLRGFVTSSQYQFLISASTGLAIATSSSYLDGNWHFYSGVKRGSVMYLYADGVLLGSADAGTNSVTNTSAILSFGIRSDFQFEFQGGNMALWRVSASAPSAEQIKKMYEDEKVLFQENAACTLYGSSDTVTALAYDDSNSILSVGTSSGRSDFNGLRRINNTTTAVTTAISAYDGFIVEQ